MAAMKSLSDNSDICVIFILASSFFHSKRLSCFSVWWMIFIWNLDIVGTTLYDYGPSLNLLFQLIFSNTLAGELGHWLITDRCVPYSASIDTWGEREPLLLLDVVWIQLPTGPPLMPPCTAPTWCPQGWQGKLFYHQVGMKLPVLCSAFSNTTLAGDLGHLFAAWQGWKSRLPTVSLLAWGGHGLFCGVWLKWSSYCFFLLLGYSSAPLAREREFRPFLGLLFCLYSAFPGCDFVTSKSGIYELKIKLRNSSPCRSLGPKYSSLPVFFPPFRIFLCLFYI